VGKESVGEVPIVPLVQIANIVGIAIAEEAVAYVKKALKNITSQSPKKA
jgi:hypothetical protein